MQRPSTHADPTDLPRAQACGAALVALARAARSLVLYDASNAAVRHHLAEYHLKMTRALEAHGEMNVAVTPFHLAVAGHIVLEDRDREKSFPLRLYRDGIRVVRILANAPWPELMKLLRIVAIRYAAVRQQEEDTVTLLRRAEFRFIFVDAVEGFTQVEELPEPEVAVRLERAPRARPPDGWDTPLQKLPAPGPLSYRAITEAELASLEIGGAEDDEGATSALSVALARDLLAEAARSGWPMPNRDLAAYFAEVRDALLVDGELRPLRELVDVLTGAGASALRDDMLRALGDTRTLELVLAAVPEDEDKLPPELVPFLPLLGVGPALEALTRATTAGRRELLVKVIVARLPREVEAVLARLGSLAPELVRPLADGVLARAPERSAEIARQLVTHRSDALRLEGLEVVRKAPVRIPLRPICELLGDRSDAVRVRAAEVLGARGDASIAEVLCAVFQSGRAAPPALSEAIGRSLATVAPAVAEQRFATWLEPKTRFLVGPTPEQRAQQWAAIAGLGVLPGEGAEQALRAAAERTDGEVRRHCLATLARRRKGGDARG